MLTIWQESLESKAVLCIGLLREQGVEEAGSSRSKHVCIKIMMPDGGSEDIFRGTAPTSRWLSPPGHQDYTELRKSKAATAAIVACDGHHVS